MNSFERLHQHLPKIQTTYLLYVHIKVHPLIFFQSIHRKPFTCFRIHLWEFFYGVFFFHFHMRIAYTAISSFGVGTPICEQKIHLARLGSHSKALIILTWYFLVLDDRFQFYGPLCILVMAPINDKSNYRSQTESHRPSSSLLSPSSTHSNKHRAFKYLLHTIRFKPTIVYSSHTYILLDFLMRWRQNTRI